MRAFAASGRRRPERFPAFRRRRQSGGAPAGLLASAERRPKADFLSIAESFNWALNAAYFERDLLRNERVIGNFRRRHVSALTKAMEERPPGKIAPVAELTNPDPEIIDREFIRKRKPVVLKGAARDWPAARLWSFDFFKENYGDSQLFIADEHFSRKREGLGYRIKLTPYAMRDFVGEVQKGAGIYLKFLPVFTQHPELRAHLDMEAMNRWTRGRLARCEITNEFYMGGARTITHLHTERSDIFHACFVGKKRWRLYAPSQTRYLYPIPARTLFIGSEVDFLAPDYSVHPWFRYANGYETVSEAGDVLYFPAYYWHAVENPEATISANCLWYDKWRSLRALPMHWINGEIAARNKGGTIQQFLDVFDNRILRSLHA